MTLYRHIYICMQNHNDDTIRTSEDTSLEKYTSHFIWKGWKGLLKVRGELETEQNCNILTPTFMAITAFLSCSPGLLDRGPGGPASLRPVPHSSTFSTTATAQSGPEGPASLGLVPHSSIFFPAGLTSNWLDFLCTELYNCSTFFLWASQITLIQPVHGQGYILIFLDRIHLLFTQVHFLFWQLGRGQ